MNYTTLAAAQQAIKSGKHSCLDLVNFHLSEIEKHADLNIFLEVFYGEARQRATVVDQKIKFGSAGKLAGMVIALKDNICYKEHTVSGGSKILESFEAHDEKAIITTKKTGDLRIEVCKISILQANYYVKFNDR